MASSGLDSALECVARGWAVVPGARWVGDTYVDPVTNFGRDSLALCSPRGATTDPDVVRRWWATADGGVMRSVLAVVGPALSAVGIEPGRAGAVVESESFRAAPTPLVLLPLPVAGLSLEFAVFLVSSSDGLDGEVVLPPDATVPLPPVVVEGYEVRWLVSPAECGELMSGPELARVLAESSVAGGAPDGRAAGVG